MRRTLTTIILILSFTLAIQAQTKAPVTPPDYGKWESLGPGGSYGGLSPDGKWLAYGITRSNSNNELHVTNIADGTTKVTAFGTQPSFSSDSRWVAYSIGYSEAQQDKMRKDKKPIQNKLGLLNLSTGEQTAIDGIESFSFSPSGSYLAMRRYPPEKKDTPDPAASGEADDAPQGATLILRQVSTGHDTTFGNVSEFAWQDLARTGTLLAMATFADDKAGNGVQIFNTETGALSVLDSSSATYSGLAWRKNSADLAVLRSKSDDRHENPIYSALAWSHLSDTSPVKHEYNPTADAKFPAGLRTVPFRKPTWSEDGDTVFLGVAKWLEKPPAVKKPATTSDATSTSSPTSPAAEADDPPTVDIWNYRDVQVIPLQKFRAKSDRQKNMLAAWHVNTGQFTQLGRSLTETVMPLKHQAFAFAENWDSYAMDQSIGRHEADLYVIDLSTGNRTKVKEHILENGYVSASSGGRYLLFFQDDNFWTVDVATRAVVNITKNVKATFLDTESDETVAQKPPFGVAGWTKNDAAVILYDKFDMWQVAGDGSHATRLTDGNAEQVRHRYVRLNPEDEFIDTDKPIYVSLFGIWTKKSGYGRIRPSATGVEHLIWLDKAVERLAKAKDADVYEYTEQTFTESPNAFVGGPELKNMKQVTNTNPFQSDYAWGHEELVEYKNSHGERLQGALYYPAGYEPGKKYPMIVYMYEKLSDGLHHYSALSERSYYNVAAFTSHGYFLLEPDIVFQPRDPGVSVVDCVTSAVKKVLTMGAVDPKKVGVIGHSWGGFDAAYLATHTNDFFAAAVAGAPITDLVSNYGNHHWSIGIAETDHIETGQQRMQVPLYEDLQAYIRNSAVFNVQNMNTPLMIEVGDSDGTVFFHQGVELYNIARRAKKNVVLLLYGGEDHGLRKKSDQIDYERRIFTWFGHYLKDEAAPAWIIDGESYLDQQRDLKRTQAQK